MSLPRLKRSWFRPTRRRVILVAAFIGFLMLSSAEPDPIIRYSGGGEVDPVAFENLTNPIFQQLTESETVEYAADLRVKLEEAKVPIVSQLKGTLTQQQNERSLVILRIMLVVAFLGLFMLAAPFVLVWKHPIRRFPVLVWYSGISAALFVLVGSILVGLYALTRFTSGLVSTAYNPQLSITESMFDFLISRADSLAEIGPTIIEPTVSALEEGPTSPALQVILENAESFSETLNVFVILARIAYGANIVYSFFPLALLVVAFLLFIRNAIPMMREIIGLPNRAAAGHERAARATVRSTIRNIQKETIYALGIIGVLLALTLVVSSLGRGAIEPALEIVLNYMIAAMVYAQTEAGAQPGLILFCTGIALLFLVMLLAISTLAAVLFLWRASMVLRTVTRNGAGIRSERTFWVRGTGGLVWAMFVPVIYALAASPVISLWGQWAVDSRTWGVMFVLMPLALVAGFFVAFWAGNGFKTLMFVRRYQPMAIVGTAGAGAAVASEMAGQDETGLSEAASQPLASTFAESSESSGFDISA